jgi:putative phosphoesterase
MKICIVSDTHDNRQLLEAAVAQAVARGAEAILHCGDVVAPGTLSVLHRFDLPIHVIHGNNTGDLYTLNKIASRSDNQLHYYGQDAGIELAGRRIFIVHYPHYARAMATTGDWDLVCCGHDHVAKIENITDINGNTCIYANPGTTGGVGAPASYIIGDLEAMEFEIFEINLALNVAGAKLF